MKILILSPYIPKHFGGGEKYLFDVARILIEEGHHVSVAIRSKDNLDSKLLSEIRKSYEKFLNLSLEKVNFIASPLGGISSFLKKLLWTKNFDLIYYQTDGSLFFSLAKKNILHIQLPLKLNKSSLIDKFKLKNWQIKNTNSFFTKKVIEKSWKTKIDFIHQPAIDSDEFKSGKKEKIILNVGRFFKQLHSKKQDVLIDVFREMTKNHPEEIKNWKLVLIGGVEDQSYFNEIKKKAEGLDILIKSNISRKELLGFYQKASVYWHATGFGVDTDKYPEKAEHFGISTVEAMASGAVPIVINQGGQKEILGDELKDFLWDSKIELMEKTLRIIKDKKLWTEISKIAKERSQKFSKEKFKKILLEMVAS